MNNNSRVFNDILATCTLVAMHGIIPSLLAFQSQLRQNIEQFCLGLEAGKQDAKTIDALRRLVCRVVDLNIRQGLEAQGMSWYGYELEQVLYGYNDEPLLTEQHAITLFNANNQEIIHYALQLFALSPMPLPGAELRPSLTLQKPEVRTVKPVQPVKPAQTVEPLSRRPQSKLWLSMVAQLGVVSILLALLWFICRYYLMRESASDIPLAIVAALMLLALAWYGRYLLRSRTQPAPQPIALVTPIRPAILILGPYAAKWFSQQNVGDSARYAGQAAWLLISEPQDLSKRLTHIRQHSPDAPVMAFFPLLPDGHETSELMLTSLVNWQRQFSSAQTEHPRVPCTIALYARLSNERRNNSPSNTTWFGSLDNHRSTLIGAIAELEELQHELESNTQGTANQIQRAAMGKNLLAWLQESGVTQALQQLFAHTPLQLNGMMLCDYGNGFTRHGAWSNWLEQRYAILPALSSSLSFPPLPTTAAPPSRIMTPPPLPSPPPRAYWSIGLLLLLSAHILGNTWLARQQLHQFHQQMLPISQLQELSVQKIQRYTADLKQYQQRSSGCTAMHFLLSWGLSPCSILAEHAVRHITQLQAIPTLSSAGAKAMFDSSSTRLQTDGQEMLQEMAALANAYPQHNLLLVGHSDNTGDEARNLYLSEQRAMVVRDWLMQQHINPERMTIRAAGTTEPIASNDTPLGRQQNRRVEMLVLPLQKTNKE